MDRHIYRPTESRLILILTLLIMVCGGSSDSDIATPTLTSFQTPIAAVRVPTPTPNTAELLTATPTPPPSSSSPNIDTPAGQFVTECIRPDMASPNAFQLPARRVTYTWRGLSGLTLNSLRTILDSDCIPDGGQQYDRHLLLDDARPDLRTLDLVALDAHRHAGVADRYFRGLAAKGVGIWDGCYGTSEAPIMTSRVHYPPPLDSSFRAGWQGRSYAEVLYTDKYVKQDVVTHEWTHGVVDRILPMYPVGGPDGQTGALYESIANTFAVLQRGNGGHMVGSAGEDCYISLDNPNVDHWSNFVKDGDKYMNSGIPNKAAYLIIEQLGKEKAELIYFHVLNPEFMKSAAGPGQYTFEELANGLVDACSDLAQRDIGAISETDCYTIPRAFQAVGVFQNPGTLASPVTPRPIAIPVIATSPY